MARKDRIKEIGDRIEEACGPIPNIHALAKYFRVDDRTIKKWMEGALYIRNGRKTCYRVDVVAARIADMENRIL